MVSMRQITTTTPVGLSSVATTCSSSSSIGRTLSHVVVASRSNSSSLKKPRDVCFRLFGSPFSMAFHQHLTYLHLKRLPTQIYCASFASTKVYSVYHRSKSAFCALTPQKCSCLLPWQLVERVEAVEGDYFPHNRKLLLDRRTHPQLHMLSWVLMAYSSWWLTLTGAMFRWVHGDASGIVAGYINYFLPLHGAGAYGPLRNTFKTSMSKLLTLHGVNEDTRPFMLEHFDRLCRALESHAAALGYGRGSSSLGTSSEKPSLLLYLLGTPHPTLADVAIGSAFSGYFLIDDPPSSMILESFPALYAYVQRVAGFPNLKHGQLLASPPSDDEEAAEAAEFADRVPETLRDVLLHIEEVMPFLAEQCEAFKAYMGGEGILKLKKTKLRASSSGSADGVGALEGLEAYVLQQRTDITSVMLVDRHLLSIFCRAQDLEIATIAAREVLDVELGPFNRLLSIGEEEQIRKRPDEENSGLQPCADNAASIPVQCSMVSVQEKQQQQQQHQQQTSESEESLLVSPVEAALNMSSVAPLSVDGAMKSSDMHHVFSAGGRRSSVRFAACGNKTDVAHRTTRDIQASLLRLLQRMHAPQFTLTATTMGRRTFVAVIPEHEYAKKRLRDAEAAAAATVPPSGGGASS